VGKFARFSARYVPRLLSRPKGGISEDLARRPFPRIKILAWGKTGVPARSKSQAMDRVFV
jgi:hypothetical protein